MADDVTLPAAGAVIATDDIGGVQHQRVKIGAAFTDVNDPSTVDGTYTDLAAQPSSMYGSPLLQVQSRPQGINQFILRAGVIGTPSAHSYVDGESIGGDLSASNGYWTDTSALRLVNLVVSDLEGVGPDLDILISGYIPNPATDATAYAMTVHSEQFSLVEVRAADYKTYGTTKVAALNPDVLVSNIAGSFEAVIIARSAYTLTDPSRLRVHGFFIYD